MRGALAGFGFVLVVSAAWAVFVLLRAWVDGDLARTFPDCDPCGLIGYARQMLVVTAMFLGIFGLPAAVVGWLVEACVSKQTSLMPGRARADRGFCC